MKLLRILGLYSFTCIQIAQTAFAHDTTSDSHELTPLQRIINLSRLPPDLDCLKLNNPADLTGYAYYLNVGFDPQIAVNPKNEDNMVMVAQQDLLSNAHYNAAVPLSTVVLFTFDGGITWNHSDLVLSRCQGATNYKANNNFAASYFPSVTFDSDGNCYVQITGYNIFAADQKPVINLDEGHLLTKSVDGGVSWNQVSAAFRDDGSCHYLDFPQIKADPYRKNTVYLVSSDNTCFVNGNCEEPDYTGNQNIVFQKSTDGGASWSPASIVGSFIPDDMEFCTPIPAFNQLEVLPDEHNTLVVSTIVEGATSDWLDPGFYDTVIAWRSRNDGQTWTEHVVAKDIPHVLAVDPDSSLPVLPLIHFATKDMAVNPRTGDIYIVYSDPQFNPTGQAGCVIRRSTDGGKHWSKPHPVNPKTVDVQAFLPTVAVAKDGTVGVMFYDLRNFTSGDEKLSTDVWLALFDEELHHCHQEVRLTPESMDARKSIRGYNGIDQMNCHFDYYLSAHLGLKTIGNDFVAAFVVTNECCDEAQIASYPCDSFPLFMEPCNRQDIAFVRIDRD